MIGQWEKLFTPSTPFLMTPSSGESIGLAALRIMRVFQANRSSTFVWRGFPRDFFSVANNLGDSVAFNLESDSRTLSLDAVGLVFLFFTSAEWQS
jgi:hypothetical protein